ncbi:unnamed protein product [Leptosia nina]|uniref:Uncharacterized protein n=1 Tax=Leptosia nina TaxID=320188 RepID=A0AAV1JWU6_9NEOP
MSPSPWQDYMRPTVPAPEANNAFKKKSTGIPYTKQGLRLANLSLFHLSRKPAGRLESVGVISPISRRAFHLLELEQSGGSNPL